jgi:hypothetical protein
MSVANRVKHLYHSEKVFRVRIQLCKQINDLSPRYARVESCEELYEYSECS